MRKKIFLSCCLLLALVIASFGQCTVTVMNASYESPLVVSPALTSSVSTATGWQAAQTVTIWSVASGTSAKQGVQFLELGPNSVSTIYQDIVTPGPAQLTITFSHRGRGGTANGGKDECELYAGSPRGSLFSLKTVSDNNSSWNTYSVVYTVPVGQPVTRFQFFGGPTASVTGGNFLDDIQIITDNSIRNSNNIALGCTASQATVVSGGLSGTWMPDVSNPSVTRIITTPLSPSYTTNSVFSGFALTGTYRYLWDTGYCTTPLTITVSTISALTPVVSYNSPVYLGNVLSLSSTASPGATYSWSGPNGFSSTLRNVMVSSNATSSMSGIYNMKGGLTNSCSSVDLVGSISVSILPVTLTFNTGPSAVLNGGSSLTMQISIFPAVTTSSQTITLVGSGSAISGTNYIGLPSTVVIPSGGSSISFTLTGLNNNILNGQSNLYINASGPYYASGGVTVSILDMTVSDPNNRVMSMSSGMVTETLSTTLTLSLPGGITTYGPITISVGGINSLLPLGYTIFPNPVVIQSGGSSASFVVQTASDGSIADNYFGLGGTAISGGIGSFSITTGFLNVKNKDQSLTINPLTITVGGSVSVSVTRSVSVGGGILSYSVSSSVGGGSATIDGFGNLTSLRAGLITLLVSSSGDSNYLPAFTTSILSIGKSTPTLTFTSGSSMVVGGTLQAFTNTTAVLSSGGVVSFSLIGGSGSATIDTSTGLMSGIGSGTVTLRASSVGDNNYYGVSTTKEISIGAGSQTLTWSSSTGSYSMTVGRSAYITASSSAAGGGAITYSIAGGSGSATVDVNTGYLTGVSVGTVTLTAKAVGSADYVEAITSTLLTIQIGSQSISPNSATALLVGNSLTLTVSRSITDTFRGGSLSYTIVSSGGGSVTLNETTGNVRGVGAGTLTVMIAALGNVNYYSPVSSTVLVTIRKATPTLAITSTNQRVSINVGGVFTLSATSTPPLGGPVSSGSISFSIVLGGQSATLDAMSGQLTASGVGQIVVQARQSSDSNYNAPLSAQLVITINRSTPSLSISSTTQSSKMTVGSVLSLTATSTPPLGGPASTGVLTFGLVSGSQSATIDALTGQLTAIRAGSILVQVSQRSDRNYNSPVMATLSITIEKSTPSLILSPGKGLASLAVDEKVTINATSVPPLPGGVVLSKGVVRYMVLSGGGSATIDPFTGELTGKGAGVVLVEAIQGGDENYYASITGTLSVTITSGEQVVSFSSSNYSLKVDELRTITATNSVSGGGTITYSVVGGSGSATVDASGRVLAVGAGTVTLVAQAGATTNYGLTSTSALLIIGKGSQSLSISPSVTEIIPGQSLQLVATTSASNGRGGVIVYDILAGSGSATVDPISGIIRAIQEGTVTFRATISGDNNYDSAIAFRGLIIKQGSQTLTVTSSSRTTVGGSIVASVTTTANASDGGLGVALYILSSTGTASATIDPVSHVLRGVAAGTVLLTVSTPGDSNYRGATISQNIVIGKGTPSLVLGASTDTVRVDEDIFLSASSVAAFPGGVVSNGEIRYRIIQSMGGGSATIDMSRGVLEGISVGSVVVEASQGSDNNYYSPLPTTITITIRQGIQTLQVVSDDFVGLNGSLSAVVVSSAKRGGGTINYSITNYTGVASVSINGVISPIQLGKVTLLVNTPGDSNYAGASTSQVITIVGLRMSMRSSTLAEGSSGSVVVSLDPVGVVLSKDVEFSLHGSITSSGQYSIPSKVTLLQGQTDVSVPVSTFVDKVLYNDTSLVIEAYTSLLGSVTGSISITDGTSLDLNNLVITLSDETIYLEGSTQVRASLPPGVSTVRPISIDLRLSSRSEFYLIEGVPEVSPVVSIAGDGRSNWGIFSVTATSANENSAKLIIEGVSVTIGGISVSGPSVKEGIVTVINQKMRIVPVVSINGDGVNDCLIIENAEKYSDNDMSIINRYGELIYQAHGYNNSDVVFCGKPNQGGIDKLTSDIYYYIIKFKDAVEEKVELFKSFIKLKSGQ